MLLLVSLKSELQHHRATHRQHT